MTTPDPTCTINGTATPQDVAANVNVNGALASTAGALFWSIACIGTDELNNVAAVNATLSVNQTAKTFSFTSPTPLGSACIFRSQVGISGLGLDANGVKQPWLTTTFKINVKASNGARVLAENETFEQSPAAGWCAVINPALRAGVDIPISVSGSGFIRVVGGIIQASASLVSWLDGGRMQGAVHVTHGSSPGLLTPLIQIAFMGSDTGTTSVTFPAAASFPSSTIPDQFPLAVLDTGGLSTTSAMTVTPSGQPVWDPTALAYTSSPFTISSNGASFSWMWDATELHWAPFAGTFGSGGGSSGGGIGTEVTVTAGSSGTLSQAVSQVLIIDTTGARPTRTFPPSPNNHDVVRATFIGASNNNGVAFTASSGQTIADPDNPGTFSATAGTVVSFTPGGTISWFFQVAASRWVIFS